MPLRRKIKCDGSLCNTICVDGRICAVIGIKEAASKLRDQGAIWDALGHSIDSTLVGWGNLIMHHTVFIKMKDKVYMADLSQEKVCLPALSKFSLINWHKYFK